MSYEDIGDQATQQWTVNSKTDASVQAMDCHNVFLSSGEAVNSIEYDDVGNRENISEEPIKYEYDYVYDHRRPPERQTK